MRLSYRGALIVSGVGVLMAAQGCRSADAGWDRDGGTIAGKSGKRHTVRLRDRVRHVFCLYDQAAWFSADRYGDRDPEGIQYRVFLFKRPDQGTSRGVLHRGVFHVDMYQIERQSDGSIQRTLVSDWHYPTERFQAIQSKYLGRGYRLELVWAKKEIAGQEVELITTFEDVDGNKVCSATKRMRVPHYTS